MEQSDSHCVEGCYTGLDTVGTCTCFIDEQMGKIGKISPYCREHLCDLYVCMIVLGLLSLSNVWTAPPPPSVVSTGRGVAYWRLAFPSLKMSHTLPNP